MVSRVTATAMIRMPTQPTGLRRPPNSSSNSKKLSNNSKKFSKNEKKSDKRSGALTNSRNA